VVADCNARPTLVIVDYHLDICNTGLDVCKLIRSFSNVPIMMLTSNTAVETLVECTAHGVDQYIKKPV